MGGIGLGGRRDGQRVDEVDVQQAVAVVVEQGDAAGHRLEDVLLLRRRVLLEGDPGLVGDVAQKGLRHRRGRGRKRGEQSPASHHECRLPQGRIPPLPVPVLVCSSIRAFSILASASR